MQFDVFNGDADGLCSLLQLRLAEPKESQLITGVKRDISLLEKVPAVAGDQITVLDVSMKKNTAALNRLLDQGVEVFYCDHHQTGEVPESPHLTSLVNTDSNVCTSLLINGHLQGQFAEWAIAGAFGDNLKTSARAVAKALDLNEAALAIIERVGILLNYNGYGANLDDLYFKPDALFRALIPFDSPLTFHHDCKAIFDQLDQGYEQDLRAASEATYLFNQPHAAVLCLPNQAWARRVNGVYSNDLANIHPDRAHAVLTEVTEGGFLVSVRAPLNNKQGADVICSQFPTGGGRAAAAGVNLLEQSSLDKFIDTFQQHYANK